MKGLIAKAAEKMCIVGGEDELLGNLQRVAEYLEEWGAGGGLKPRDRDEEARLRSEVSAAKSEAKQARENAAAREAEVVELRKQLADAASKLESSNACREQLEDLRRSKAIVEHQRAAAARRAAESEEELELQRERHSGVCEDLVNETVGLDVALSREAARGEAQGTSVASLEASRAAAESKVALLRSERDKLARSLAECEAAAAGGAAAAREAAARAEESARAASENSTRLATELADARREIDVLQIEIERKHMEVVGLRAAAATTRADSPAAAKPAGRSGVSHAAKPPAARSRFAEYVQELHDKKDSQAEPGAFASTQPARQPTAAQRSASRGSLRSAQATTRPGRY